TQLFSVSVGLWAAGICQILPGLYKSRLDFLLDYPLTAIVTLSFFCLTVWRNTSVTNKRGWLWAAAFGLSLGLAVMVKQTALFFLFTPILWVAIGTIRQRDWRRLTQLVGGLLLSVLVFGPWYRTNWLLILTGGKRATVDSAIAEGDPALNTLKAWTYYWNHLPFHVSWPLLLVPIVGLVIGYWSLVIGQKQTPKNKGQMTNDKERWLLVFLVGAYLLCSLNINKDDRYVLPYLPVLSLFLAYGLTLWRNRWGNEIRWGTVGLAILLMFLNLFPVGGTLLTQAFSPNAQHYAYLGTEWPHAQVIDEVIQTDPYLRSNLGILPSTPTINQHNFNYYGALRNFQIYGRQVGVRQKQVQQDARSLSWFITKTGDQGSVPKEAQSDIVQLVEQGSDFQLHKTWDLPDRTTLKLYHSRQPPIQVQPLTPISSIPANGVGGVGVAGGAGVAESVAMFNEIRITQSGTKVKLERVTVPEQVPPGKPIPVTYEWSGSWEQLQPGLVLLTWRPNFNNPKSKIQNPKSHDLWLHDHGIGMGSLYPRVLPPARSHAAGFRVIEQTAMLPPDDTAPGIYTLEATYLNRQTGETYPIPVPPVSLKIDPTATAVSAPELDLITQMRTLAAGLPNGLKGLEPIFEQTGRINQYDPIQDYLVQAAQALEYRLRQEPQNKDGAYALALSRALQQQVQGAIAALQRVVQVDSQNPYAHAYLAFVYLYDWHPKQAQNALKPALALNPNLPELQALNGAAALMQGNFLKAWQTFRELKNYKP
ncbi:MAG TPA: phospholipid carrier-dependent glycosyltransferase, partial [Candidatus Obscuribacterales bacterium]